MKLTQLSKYLLTIAGTALIIANFIPVQLNAVWQFNVILSVTLGNAIVITTIDHRLDWKLIRFIAENHMLFLVLSLIISVSCGLLMSPTSVYSIGLYVIRIVTTAHALFGCLLGAIFFLAENEALERMLAQMSKRWESIVENKIKPLFVEK